MDAAEPSGRRAAPMTKTHWPVVSVLLCRNLGSVNLCSIRVFLLRKAGSLGCRGVTRHIWVLNILLGAVGEWT